MGDSVPTPASTSLPVEFSFSARVGLLFTVQAASLSILSAAFILGLAFHRWLKRTANEIPRPSDASDSSLFLNLMFADLVQALGAMPNLRWMMDAHITEGSLCTAQAVLKQLGIVGAALTSLMIAIHTFVVLVGRWREPQHTQKYMLIAVWVCTALIVGIPNAVHHGEKYYGPAQYWCWIPSGFRREQIATEYLWVWTAALSMAGLYGLSFVILKRSACQLKDLARVTGAHESDEDFERTRRTMAIAYSLLFYPVVYIACIFPNSLSRWMYFKQTTNVPIHFTFFANTIFSLSGLFNLVLFFITRPAVVIGPQAQTSWMSATPSPRQSRIMTNPRPPRNQGPGQRNSVPMSALDGLRQPTQGAPTTSSIMTSPSDMEKFSHRSDPSITPPVHSPLPPAARVASPVSLATTGPFVTPRTSVGPDIVVPADAAMDLQVESADVYADPAGLDGHRAVRRSIASALSKGGSSENDDDAHIHLPARG